MWDSFLLVIALSIDSFLASLAYGAEYIYISWKSASLISLIGVMFLSFSFYTANYLQNYLSPSTCHFISFILLLCIGISILFQGTIKAIIKKYHKKKIKFEYSGIMFVIDVFLDETKADMDKSKSLSIKESIFLAITLSIDSLASGFAVGMQISQPLPVLVCSFLIGIISILSGSFVGEKIGTLKYNLSWLSGILFLILAFMKVL